MISNGRPTLHGPTHANAQTSSDGRVGIELDKVEAPVSPEKLANAFGWGEIPRIRKALYERLSRLCNVEGPKAVRIVFDVAKVAKRKESPGRYFCYVVVARLREHGYDI